MNLTFDPSTVTMETYEHLEKKFMAKFQRYEPKILDHTAIIAAKKCFRYYFYRIVLGFAPAEDAIYFAWGSAYHAFRQALSEFYGYGDNEPEKFDQTKATEAILHAAKIGLKYWQEKGKEQDVTSKFNWMTSPRLIQSFKVAGNHWMEERKAKKIKVLAVEQPFNIKMKDGSYRSGRADEIIRLMNKTWGRDFKTSSKESAFYARTLSPNEQFTGYTWAESKLSGTIVQGQLVEVLYNAKPTKTKENGPEINTHVASRTEEELDMWEKEHMFFKTLIDKCREEDIWPMCEVSCTFCEFHGVCEKGNEASMMYQLETKYKRSPWDNTKVGHDL